MNQIKAIRKAMGLSAEQIASALYVAPSTVYRWESGECDLASLPLCRLADLLGVTTDALLGREGTHTPNDQDHLKGANIMITRNGLLALVEVKRVTIYVPATPRVYTRVDFDPQDGAILDDVTKLYGHLRVKTIGPIYKGDERLVVKLGE